MLTECKMKKREMKKQNKETGRFSDQLDIRGEREKGENTYKLRDQKV